MCSFSCIVIFYDKNNNQVTWKNFKEQYSSLNLSLQIWNTIETNIKMKAFAICGDIERNANTSELSPYLSNIVTTKPEKSYCLICSTTPRIKVFFKLPTNIYDPIIVYDLKN